NKYAYAIYLMSGLLGWNLFSDIVSRCTNLFIAHAHIMKKMSFPRITLPVIAVGSSIVNNLLLFIAILVIFALLGHQFSLVMLWFIPLTLLISLFAAGLGLILGVMNVFVRDTGQGFTVILQVWFWFTPIIYPVNIIPERYLPLMQLNPMYAIVDAYHQILAYNQAPSFQSLTTILFISSGLIIFGLLMFRKASPEMVDVL
ncbi:ABC transporter permease, partial [Candidatus Poseidoniaceae archaeon]|nr:ABC transporter permease [Candidatus Poseidoniaceae archaeon]